MTTPDTTVQPLGRHIGKNEVLLLLHSFNGLFSTTTWVSRHQKSRTIMVKPICFYWSKRQWVAVASAGPYANLHLAFWQITMPTLHHSVFYRPDTLPAAQPTASKHWRQKWYSVLVFKTKLCYIKCADQFMYKNQIWQYSQLYIAVKWHWNLFWNVIPKITQNIRTFTKTNITRQIQSKRR